MKFSEALDEYLDLRDQGPRDLDGFTDKSYYQRMQELRDRMDELASVDREDV